MLWEELLRPCAVYREALTSDGEGGHTVELEEIMQTRAAVFVNESSNRVFADRLEDTSVHTVISVDEIPFDSIIECNGFKLRTTSKDVPTCSAASFEFHLCYAEVVHER